MVIASVPEVVEAPSEVLLGAPLCDVRRTGSDVKVHALDVARPRKNSSVAIA